MAQPTVEEFETEVAGWLREHGTPVEEGADFGDVIWGHGDFSVSVFHNMTHEEESTHLEALRSWNQLKVSQGYHAVMWAEEYGGLDLSRAHNRAYGRAERGYQLPDSHELFSVTVGLMAPTIRAFGTPEQKDRFIRDLLATNIYCCQLFLWWNGRG